MISKYNLIQDISKLLVKNNVFNTVYFDEIYSLDKRVKLFIKDFEDYSMVVITRDGVSCGFAFSYNDDKNVSMIIKAGAYSFIEAINGEGIFKRIVSFE